MVFCSSTGRVNGRTKELAASRAAAEKEIPAGGEIGKKSSPDNVGGQFSFRERDQIDSGIRLNGREGGQGDEKTEKEKSPSWE